MWKGLGRNVGERSKGVKSMKGIKEVSKESEGLRCAGSN
jgi:hypothetical protein